MVAALIVRDVPAAVVCRTNAIIRSTRRRTRCCDAQGAGAVVLRKNAICTARRVAALIVRECLSFCAKMPSVWYPSCTRCCDAQGAGAVVLRINAISATRRGDRVNRRGQCLLLYRINAINQVPVVVPVVVMLSAPEPSVLA